jgi:UDP-3-O-[3-hydroxymyristoyl] glucosamine N-acyltransferase
MNSSFTKRHLSELLALLAKSGFGADRVDQPKLTEDPVLSGFGALAKATADEMSFCSDKSHFAALGQSQASVVLVSRSIAAHAPKTSAAIVTVEDAYLASAYLLNAWLAQPAAAGQIAPSAIVHPEAQLHSSVCVGDYAVVEAGAVLAEGVKLEAQSFVGARARIGADSRLHPGARVLAGCEVGARCTLHSGVVVGADGFGYARDPALGGAGIKFPQIARVILKDDVEVGANSTIDRGALSDTIIERGVKIDNLVQIAHGVRIGEHSALAGCAGVAGSAQIGAHCFIGGGAVVLGHLSICDRVMISAGSVVSASITEPGQYTGLMPLDPHAQWQKNAALVRRLGLMQKDLRDLKKTS